MKQGRDSREAVRSDGDQCHSDVGSGHRHALLNASRRIICHIVGAFVDGGDDDGAAAGILSAARATR